MKGEIMTFNFVPNNFSVDLEKWLLFSYIIYPNEYLTYIELYFLKMCGDGEETLKIKQFVMVEKLNTKLCRVGISTLTELFLVYV